MTLREIIKEKEERVVNALRIFGVFFAFNKEQFEKGKEKNQLPPGEKYCIIGGGGYMLSRNKEAYKQHTQQITEDFFKAIEDNNLKDEYILYELENQECFYTYDLEEVYEMLPYSKAEINKVFNEHFK